MDAPEHQDEAAKNAVAQDAVPVEAETREVAPAPTDMFPTATPQSIHAAQPPSEWKRYLFPVFLVGLAALVMGFLYLDAQREAARTMNTATNETTDKISYEDRVNEAEEIMTSAEAIYTDGFEGINDHDQLHKARVMYMEAWTLLTGREWNGEFPKLNEAGKVLHDSSRARILRNDAYNKLIALEAELDGWSFW